MSNRLKDYKEKFIGYSNAGSDDFNFGTNGNEAVSLKLFPFAYFFFYMQRQMAFTSYFFFHCFSYRFCLDTATPGIAFRHIRALLHLYGTDR